MDEKIDNMIKEIFKSLDTIDQVLIVVKSSLNRLLPAEKYCCGMISRLYGKDVMERIIGMISHSDNSESMASFTMEAANVKFWKEFKFNNAANFTRCRNSRQNQLQYNQAKRSFKSFNTYIRDNNLNPMSLTLTR